MAIAALLLLALALRTGTAIAWPQNLVDDRDAYRAIAAHVAAGDGFSASEQPAGDPRPTAFRPPLYPLVLAGVVLIGGGEWGVALLHVVLGGLTVLLTFLIARRVGLGGAAWLAGGLVAVDPLLIWYTTFPMTETLSAFLVTLLLAVLVGVGSGQERTAASAEPPGRLANVADSTDACNWTRLRSVTAGVAFGLCALTRPTIWAFLPLAAACWLWRCLRAKRSKLPSVRGAGWRLGPCLRRGLVLPCGPAGAAGWPAVLGAVVVIAPWAVRNSFLFGRPIVTTTHGGYTLLLGNNPVFYHEVVARPWGTVWDDAAADWGHRAQRGPTAWLNGVEAELRTELGPQADDEPCRDRWMYRRARDNIATEPGLFLRSCRLRFLRFWNVVPLSPARGAMPTFVLWSVGLFYAVVTATFLLGLGRLCVSGTRRAGEGSGGRRASDLIPWFWPVLLIASFCLVHLFFWSNARMRAPIVPAIAVVAAAGCRLIGRRPTAAAEGVQPHSE